MKSNALSHLKSTLKSESTISDFDTKLSQKKLHLVSQLSQKPSQETEHIVVILLDR